MRRYVREDYEEDTAYYEKESDGRNYEKEYQEEEEFDAILKKNIERIELIQNIEDDVTINMVLDTLKKKKQALVFVNTKQRAEKTAEEIAKKVGIDASEKEKLNSLSEEILNALSKPTKQCERLAFCVKKSIAFHHAGLAQKQREAIEDSFRKGIIKIICCTPTLAYGVDLPAFRVIVKDLKRFGYRGTDWIPVLEVQQMFGRAGRPNYDNEGQAICIARTAGEERGIYKKYIKGKPEEIYSKLAVEPVLRTYLLSLIATGFVNSRKTIFSFFKKTFWAYQFHNMQMLNATINKMLALLKEWDFITEKKEDFVSADSLESSDAEFIEATLLGKRVAELYIDPLTAHEIIDCLKNALRKPASELSFLQMICNTLEMYPLLNVRTKEYEEIEETLLEKQELFLQEEPKLYDAEYDEFLKSIKTALMFMDWIDEKSEEYILEKYNVRPGELAIKKNIADWLLYSAEELARILKFRKLINEIAKLRIRVDYGAKEELLPLLRLEQVGRVRARILYNNRIRDIGDVKKADMTTLSQLLGHKIALEVKKQVGQEFSEEKVKVKEHKRKGQVNIKDFS